MSVGLSPAASSPASKGRVGPRGGRAGRAGRQSLAAYLPAAIVLVAVFLLLEYGLSALQIESFLLPKPSAIAASLAANWSTGRFALVPAAVATLQEALLGLVIGTVAGLLAAFATARWATSRQFLLPIAIAANAIPIVAFAPLLNNWFGLLNPFSKAMMAAVLVFFPVMANVTRGLVQVELGSLELMRSYAASEWTILRKVRIPNALPFFFTAMKIATTLSLIGAIVGDYFGGSLSSLGRRIVESAASLKFDVTWSAILFGAVSGMVLYALVVLAERLVIPWAAALRGDT
ncbi:MAG: ABC transporter permease subunit [Chloroflexota bacterium]